MSIVPSVVKFEVSEDSFFFSLYFVLSFYVFDVFLVSLSFPFCHFVLFVFDSFQNLLSRVREAKKVELQTLLEQQQRAQDLMKEKKITDKYKMVRFFERRKLERKIRTLAFKISPSENQQTDGTSTSSSVALTDSAVTKQRMKAQLAKLQEDLDYVIVSVVSLLCFSSSCSVLVLFDVCSSSQNFPRGMKYIALFPADAASLSPEQLETLERQRQKIKDRIETDKHQGQSSLLSSTSLHSAPSASAITPELLPRKARSHGSAFKHPDAAVCRQQLSFSSLDTELEGVVASQQDSDEELFRRTKSSLRPWQEEIVMVIVLTTMLTLFQPQLLAMKSQVWSVLFLVFSQFLLCWYYSFFLWFLARDWTARAVKTPTIETNCWWWFLSPLHWFSDGPSLNYFTASINFCSCGFSHTSTNIISGCVSQTVEEMGEKKENRWFVKKLSVNPSGGRENVEWVNKQGHHRSGKGKNRTRQTGKGQMKDSL